MLVAPETPPKHIRVTTAQAGTVDIVKSAPDSRIRVRFVQVSADGAVYAYLTFRSEANNPERRILPNYLVARQTIPHNLFLLGEEVVGPPQDTLQIVTDANVNVDVQVDYDLV